MSGSRWSLAKNADLGVWLDLISNAYYYLLTVEAIDGHRVKIKSGNRKRKGSFIV